MASKREKLQSNPDNDRDKRKAALQAAREKLAQRKRQREELRQQRAARLNGKIDTLSSFQATSASASAKSASSTINKLNQSSSIKKERQKPLLDLDDFKEKPSVPNKASLLRAPRKYVI